MPKTYAEKRAHDLGIPVIDGKVPVRVVVTNSDVVSAKKANSEHCALARASMRMPGVAAAYFFRTTAYLEYHDRLVRYQLPPSVQKEIVSFDREKIFAAGQYQLTPPTANRDRASTAMYRKRRAATQRPVSKPSRKRELDRTIAKVAAQDPVIDTPESREFERIVSGIVGSPQTKQTVKPVRYQHRTQYVRDAREPK